MPSSGGGGSGGGWGWFKTQQSKVIHNFGVAVLTARMTVTSASLASQMTLYLSNDNGSSWDIVTSGVTNTFDSSASTDKVLWKVVANTGVEITGIRVEMNPV